MFVIAGSASTAAISPPASALRRPARSLNSTATVVAAGSTGGPTFPSRLTVLPAALIAKASSTEPW